MITNEEYLEKLDELTKKMLVTIIGAIKTDKGIMMDIPDDIKEIIKTAIATSMEVEEYMISNMNTYDREYIYKFARLHGRLEALQKLVVELSR